MIARTILVSLTIGGGTAAPVASKTLGDPQAPHDFIRGFCYISECAPGPDRASWCGPTNEFVQSDFCQSSESDCLACNPDKPFVWNDSRCYGGTFDSCAATCPFKFDILSLQLLCKAICVPNCLLSPLDMVVVLTVDDGKEQLARELFDA